MKKIAASVFAFLVIILGYLIVFPDRPEIKNATPEGDNIICFGDSLTYGTGASPGMDYPSQLSAMTGQTIINAGVPGDTTGSALKRLENDVLSDSPKIVLITLGGNDLKNKVPREKAFENLRRIIELIQEKGALVVVGGIDIPLFGRGFGDEYEDVSKETGAVLIPNIYKGLLNNPSLMSDTVHPNDNGYAIMAQRFYEAIRPYL